MAKVISTVTVDRGPRGVKTFTRTYIGASAATLQKEALYHYTIHGNNGWLFISGETVNKSQSFSPAHVVSVRQHIEVEQQ